MSNPTAAMLVIGDEILSGRTRDANMYHLAGRLSEMGIDLKEVRVVSDEDGEIVSAVNGLRGKFDHVFTSGGIGPTHDDITADNVAAAFGVPGVAMMRLRFWRRITRMGAMISTMRGCGWRGYLRGRF